jgi:hypothetical protein
MVMHRSKESVLHLQSTANASWGKSHTPSPYPEPNELFKGTPRGPSVCFDRLLLQLQRDRRQCLNESPKREHNQTSRKITLVDDIKMDRLLALLRTSHFVGTMDPQHHSHYLSEELLEESAKNCTVNKLMKRRSLVAMKSHSSHFKAALKRARSTPAVAR